MPTGVTTSCGAAPSTARRLTMPTSVRKPIEIHAPDSSSQPGASQRSLASPNRDAIATTIAPWPSENSAPQ